VNRKTAKRKHNSYSIEQKKQVVAYAKENRRNKAANAFNLDRSMVGRWIKANRLWITGMNQSIKRIEQRKQGLGVTFDFARIEIFKILKEPDMRDLYGNSAKNFKASHRWMFAFMKKYDLSRWQHGTKFSSICIFKEKQLPHGKNILPGVIAWFQYNGWMDTSLMIRYIDYLNNMKINNEYEIPTMIVYDLFSRYFEDFVKDRFQNSGINLVVIPGGLTSICQPLDIAVNKPFKDNLRKKWHLWMSKGGAGVTKAGNLRHARIVIDISKNIEIINISEDESIEIIDISKDIEIINVSEDEDIEIIDISKDIEIMNVSEDKGIEFIDIREDIKIINSEDNNIVNLSKILKLW
ncbi:20037_t:CDS:2, partial [Racocetra persica]